MLIIVLPGIWIYCIQFYKGFSKNLNSIYLDREETLVQFYGNEEEVTIRGAIDIINCSNDIQEFKIKIKTSSFIKEDIKEEYVTLENEVKLYPKEEKTLTINEVIKADREYKNSVYASEAFEYIFFNDEGEVVFKGTLDFY